MSSDTSMPRRYQLEHALGSPLRLLLVAELLKAAEQTLSLDEAVLRSARHVQDVLACLRPLAAWGIVAELDGGTSWRLRGDMPAELRQVIETAVHERADKLAQERRVRHELLGGMIGADAKMQIVAEMVRQVARLDVPVLITGETGTGKQLVARAVHESSPHSAAFFGDVNCATFTETLFESHIFGHARGAFTGAVTAHAGLIERCDGGTLFLDEIGDLSVGNQVKLLKVLQSKSFTRLGETTVRRSDFRLVAATNRHLPAMVAERRFREDLYYRINVFPILLPALRERLDDLPHLVDALVARNADRIGRLPGPPLVTAAALERLRGHRWPGNVRELENVLLRAAIMSDGAPIDVAHLPPLGGEGQPDRDPDCPAPTTLRSMAAVERDHLEAVLAALDGNVTAAAEVLEISRTTLYKKLREHQIAIVRATRRRAAPAR